MKTIVIYKSSTGFTKRYAHWIASELKCEIKELQDMNSQNLKAYDMVIYGGGLMAGKVKGLDKIKKHIGGQKLIIFATGATSMQATDVIEKIKNENTDQLTPFFYFSGGVNYEEMGFASRKMLKMIYKSLKKKAERTPEEQGMVIALEASNDQTNQMFIEPLIQRVRQTIS